MDFLVKFASAFMGVFQLGGEQFMGWVTGIIPTILMLLVMMNAIIALIGDERIEVIAKVCTYLAEQNINILDISQTIVGGFFNMMMIVDVSRMEQPFGELVSALEGVGSDVGVVIHCQKEDIFTMMHRI